MVLRKSKRCRVKRGLAVLALARTAAAALPGAKRRRERRRRRALALAAAGAASAGAAGALARRRRAAESVPPPAPPPPSVTNLGPVSPAAQSAPPGATEQHPAYEAPLGGDALPGGTAEALAAPDDSALLDAEARQAEIEPLEQSLEPEAQDFPPSEPNQSAPGDLVPPPSTEVIPPQLVDPDLPNEGAPGSAPTVGADVPLGSAREPASGEPGGDTTPGSRAPGGT